MKKLFAVLMLFILPFITFGDVLPEDITINNKDVIINEDSENFENSIQNVDLNDDVKTVNNNILEISENTTENGNHIEPLDEMPKIEDGGLGDLHFGFCNEGIENFTTSLNAGVQQGTPFKVCIIWNNPSDRDISIHAGVVSTEFDNMGDITCDTDTYFQNFITSGELGDIIIPADNYLIKEFEITFPLGYQGEQKGCVVYNVNNPDSHLKEGESGIEIIIRKGFYMNFFVGALDGIKNEFTINDLSTKFDDNKDLIMSFWVENTGNMENTFDIQGTVKGLFGYNKPFEITDGQLAPGKSQFVEINLGSLPSYGGKYNIDFTINGTPYFSYDISNANVDPARLEPKSWEFSTSVFKMPWLILAVVVIFILLLIVLFKKPKQKVVYVQQQPTQPIQPQQPVQPQQVQPQQSMQQPTQQYTQPVQPSQTVQLQQPQNPNYPNQQ